MNGPEPIRFKGNSNLQIMFLNVMMNLDNFLTKLLD